MDLIERAAQKLKNEEKKSLLERATNKTGNADEQDLKVPASMIEKSVAGEANAPAPSPETIAPSPQPAKTVSSAHSERNGSKQVSLDLVSLREEGYIMPDMAPTLMAEEFRIIKRQLILNSFAEGDGKINNGNMILITSANPNEGKTYCAINLALSIASEQDVTVLLVDADFSKPEVLSRLGVAGGKGLMDVVADPSLDVGDYLLRTNIPNFAILPAGRQHNRTTELLASDRMGKIVDEIAERYPDRIVIFDSPPTLASSASSVLALHMGQIVFVIEAENTTEPQIQEAIPMVSACENINLLLNRTKFSGSSKKFATYYGYGGR